MINLLQYDNVNNVLDRSKTWINVANKAIYSREIEFKPYYCFKQKYNSTDYSYNYYIILSDYPIPSSPNFKTNLDEYGRVKLKYNKMLTDSWINNLKKDYNIDVEIKERDETTIVYKTNL